MTLYDTQAALSAMLLLELPHVNVLSKVDLLHENRAQIEQCVTECWGYCADALSRFLQPDARQLSDSLSSAMGGRYPRLHQSIASLVCPPRQRVAQTTPP